MLIENKLNAVEDNPEVNIIDIRGSTLVSNTNQDIMNAIMKGLSSNSVPFTDPRKLRKGEKPETILLRSLPTMLLYDDYGLDIFDKITYDKDYYLTKAEIDILLNNSRGIVRDYVKDGAVLIELGAGAMRKTKIILDALAESKKKVTYCAVDLARDSLIQSLTPLVKAYPTINFIGLWGTYHDSLDWTQKNISSHVRKMYIWLGSSIGNLTRSEAADFMTTFQSKGMNMGDMFLCGIDRRNSFDIVSLAYNDRSGLSREFSLNGLDHANSIFKHDVFQRQNFEFVSIYNEIDGRHEAYYESLVDQTIEYSSLAFKVELKKGELISFEYSYKYSIDEVDALLHSSQLSSLGKWSDGQELYDLHALFKPPVFFERILHGASLAQPTILDWENLWRASDFITTQVITPDRYRNKPIDLRHPYIFYLGHLPSFMDIQLSKALGESYSEPFYFTEIFERGIDPNFDDPSKCHQHSRVPTEWPNSDEIFAYRDRVRNRLRLTLSSPISKRVSRAITMAFEHEAMHIETLLYMFMQDGPNSALLNTLPLPIFTKKPREINPASWIKVQGRSIILGVDDDEGNDFVETSPGAPFGWDNEKPSQTVSVSTFEIQHRPITVWEYQSYLNEMNWRVDLIPASWEKKNSEWCVRSLFGPISIEHAALWPASVSQQLARGFAAHHRLELATEEQFALARAETPDSLSLNHSFANFSPKQVILGNSGVITDLVGSGWEWTSTKFQGFNGFTASELYPGYSADFFEDDHFIALGASWATVSRIATRATFRNWYQGKYPFVFSKFRLVRNLEQ